jgi:hypothetical protein
MLSYPYNCSCVRSYDRNLYYELRDYTTAPCGGCLHYIPMLGNKAVLVLRKFLIYLCFKIWQNDLKCPEMTLVARLPMEHYILCMCHSFEGYVVLVHDDTLEEIQHTR